MNLTFGEIAKIVFDRTGKCIKDFKPVVLRSQEIFEMTGIEGEPSTVYFGDVTIRTDLRAYFLVGSTWVFSHNSDESIPATIDTVTYRNVLFDRYNVPSEQSLLNADHILYFSGYQIKLA